jgi:hypothetical protein
MSYGRNEVDGTEEFGEVRPICGFCNKPWTDGMVKVFQEVATDGYESTGYYAVGTAHVDITCSHCNRLIYRKEGREMF